MVKLKDLLHEIGEGVRPYRWGIDYDSDGEVQYGFETDTNSEYQVSFESFGEYETIIIKYVELIAGHLGHGVIIKK